MRRKQRNMAEEFIQTLFEAHDEIKKHIRKGGPDGINIAMDLLGQCQDGAVQIGTMIEESEGEGFRTVEILEEYCELLYRAYEALQQASSPDAAGASAKPVVASDAPASPANPDKIFKAIHRKLIQVQNSMKNDIPARIEAVFLPYKASMWDSLESVWMAADGDENCDAYVIPIPYFDRNADGSLGKQHWEGEQYPDYVPITHYNEYDFEAHQPDMVFIHNPYDEYNTVTSVHPFFYSKNLKQYTDELVYVPYYTTSGGMSESRALCESYYHVDHIIMQAESYRKLFDPDLPQDKLVALGSPKFDRTVRLCSDPPEPPAPWKGQLAGKKVYFYNTSIGGMLADTEQFLKKMRYVFRCFEGREDACILWRPHPLLESTFDSMRPVFKAEYLAIKQDFMDRKLGIFDDTPDMNNTIALCDAYIGDGASSLTSLFGVAGKPVFILNNGITTEPEEDDWRGEIIRGVSGGPNAKWMLTQGNKVYYSPNNDYRYEFYCDLSEYARGDYYLAVGEVDGTVYAYPKNAQELLILEDHKIKKRIKLEQRVKQGAAFCSAVSSDSYFFLLPNRYPAIVRYDRATGDIKYITDGIDIFSSVTPSGERLVGGRWVQDGWIYLASPRDNQVLALYAETGEMQALTSGAVHSSGCLVMMSDGTDIWILPVEGTAITRWNPVTGESREYTELPEDFRCIDPATGEECTDYPFSMILFSDGYAYLSPLRANMYVRIHIETGRAEEWMPPFGRAAIRKHGYYAAWNEGTFVWRLGTDVSPVCSIFSAPERKLYNVNLETNEYEEVPIQFDREELKQHEPGFMESSEWMQYMCLENAFNSLPDFLNDDITGNAFDRERQLKAFRKINAVTDGTSGDRIYAFARDKL